MKEKIRINFNEPHITYKLSDGTPVVGVTTAIGILNKPALVPWAYKRGKDGLSLYDSRDKAANIGTIVHARIMAYFKGFEIDNSNISPECWKASEESMRSFFEWAKNKKIIPLVIEEPAVNEKYKYGGTPDLYALIDDEPTLTDFKTGSGIYDEHFIQLAAYLNLPTKDNLKVKKAIILNIPKSKDDSFQIKSISAKNLKDEFKIFLNCVNIYYLTKKIENNKKGEV